MFSSVSCNVFCCNTTLGITVTPITMLNVNAVQFFQEPRFRYASNILLTYFIIFLPRRNVSWIKFTDVRKYNCYALYNASIQLTDFENSVV
jgi:hypothetical protein